MAKRRRDPVAANVAALKTAGEQARSDLAASSPASGDDEDTTLAGVDTDGVTAGGESVAPPAVSEWDDFERRLTRPLRAERSRTERLEREVAILERRLDRIDDRLVNDSNLTYHKTKRLEGARLVVVSDLERVRQMLDDAGGSDLRPSFGDEPGRYSQYRCACGSTLFASAADRFRAGGIAACCAPTLSNPSPQETIHRRIR